MVTELTGISGDLDIQPHPQEISSIHALQRAHLYGSIWDRGQLLPAATPINEEHDQLEIQLGDHQVQRDTMTARLRACKDCSKQQPRWFTQNLDVFYHLGFDAANGHYCIDIQDGGNWWFYDDAKDTVKFSALPWVAQEDCCLPWF